MSFILALRKMYYEVESVDELESIIPDIVIESANYCIREGQPFTPTYAYLKKEHKTVHFLLDYDNFVFFFDILRRDKNVDCAAAPLHQFMSGEHNIKCGPLAHWICDEFRDTIRREEKNL